MSEAVEWIKSACMKKMTENLKSKNGSQKGKGDITAVH